MILVRWKYNVKQTYINELWSSVRRCVQLIDYSIKKIIGLKQLI